MRIIWTVLLLVLAASLSSRDAYAAVNVTFAGGRYTDGKTYEADTRGAIRAQFQRLGARYLGPRDTLNITVLNIDLAGFDLSSVGPSRLRIYNGTTTPKITLRYQLVRSGKLVASGEETLTDHFYLGHPGASQSSDRFRYEKSLIDDWFRQKFSASR